jgi:fatty-acyl-CoA synthase
MIDFYRHTIQDYESKFAERHLLHGVLEKWARAKPRAIALINAETGEAFSWRSFDRTTTALAVKLLQLGFAKGDFLVALLPFSTEHILLEYACFKIGVIHAPLEVRLKQMEILRCLHAIRPKGFAHSDAINNGDCKETYRVISDSCPFIEHFIHIPPEFSADGVISFTGPKKEGHKLSGDDPTAKELVEKALVKENDPAQVVFTTGSTGYPKPALLSHRNITCQNMCLGSVFGLGESTRTLVNLPASHVGGQAAQLMTTFFLGGTAIVLPFFDPEKSLRAIQNFNVNIIGQVPAMYQLEWQLPDYSDYDLSGLDLAIVSGQKVTDGFVDKLLTMAPRVGMGLSLTEASCFCTYALLDDFEEKEVSNLGYDMPIYRLSIREPMRGEGVAGDELPDGEIGNICFSGPQTFEGYANDLESTAKAVSSDGFLYTGDMGFRNEQGLYFTDRAKWVIKPKGFQVFPGQVEDFFCMLGEKVSACGVIGLEHEIFSEEIIAFIETPQGSSLTVEELMDYAKGLPSYMRPSRYILLGPHQLPLNRLGKIDYLHLQKIAKEDIEAFRQRGHHI